MQETAEDRERHRGLIERAVDLYTDDDIEIDAHGTVISKSEEGASVMGWLWVTKREDECAPLEANADAAVRSQEDQASMKPA